MDQPSTEARGSSRSLRLTVSAALGAAFGIFAFSAGAGLTSSWWLGAAAGAAVAAAAALVLWKRPPVELDGAACPGALKVVSGIAALAALLLVGRLGVFMADGSRRSWSSLPFSEWEFRHSCASAYFVAAREARTANVYEASLYSTPGDDGPRKPKRIGPFRVDEYEYPPPFLTLPRAVRQVAPEFDRFRALWFGLTSAAVLWSMLLVCGSMGAQAGTRALLLSPLVWAALPTLSTLQKGNVQGLVIALSMAAMVLFDRGRSAAGGALLAFATVSKLYPGMLLVYLFARRDFRAIAWTAGFAAVFVAVSLVDLGAAQFSAFLAHLPGLVGGEAFPAFRNPPAMAVNHSIPGLVFKLKLFGVPGMSFATAKALGWLYTLVALWATFRLGRSSLPERQRAIAWLAVLIFATLRSPFLPQAYAAFPPLWLITLLGAVAAPTARTLWWTLAAWFLAGLFWPLDLNIDVRLLALLTSIPQGLTIALAAWVVKHAAETDSGAPLARERAAVAA